MDKNLRLHVISIARNVRAWAEFRNNRQTYPGRNLNGWCAIASAQLSREFSQNDIKHEIHMSETDMGNHVYVIVDDHVVDVTATQFSEFKNENIVILHHREADLYWFWRSAYVFQTANELRKHQRKTGWPIDQTAYSRLVN